MKKILSLFLIGTMFLIFQALPTGEESKDRTIKIWSPEFGEGGTIPSDFTCDGADMSPPVEWSDVPNNTKSLALIVEDPDAPKRDWTHWVIYDLSPNTVKLPPGIASGVPIPGGGIQGWSDFERAGYGGPCPPSGVHRYFFKIYALDAVLGLGSGATKQELLEAMQGHLLAEGQLMGTYARS